MNAIRINPYGLIGSTNMLRKDRLRLTRKRSSTEVLPLSFAVGLQIDNLRDAITPLSVHLPHERKAMKRDKNTFTFFLVIPKGVSAGEEFVFFTEKGLAVRVITPPNSKSDDMIIVHLKKDPKTNAAQADVSSSRSSSPLNTQVKIFDIRIPADLEKNDNFAVIARGRAFIVSSLPWKEERLHLHLPIRLFPSQTDADNEPNGWTRAVTIPRFETQWIQSDSSGRVIESIDDINSSAFIRDIRYAGDDSTYMLEGKIGLYHASTIARNIDIRGFVGVNLISNIDLISAQNLNFAEKVRWFRKQHSTITSGPSSSSLYVSIQRDKILPDTLNFIMSLSREDLLKNWSVTFNGERSTDSNITTREWFDLVTDEILHPQNGLFQFSANNNMRIQINPSSGMANPDSHLIYFRVLGRILAKAVCEGYQIPIHMSIHLYKLLVGWPLVFEDLKSIDEACYDFFVEIQNVSPTQLSNMRIPFSAMVDVMGYSEEVEIIPGGRTKVVTVENLSEYLEASLKYYLFGEVKDQVTEFLLGFYDVIPEPLLSIFNADEVEILMSGSKHIDVIDWKRNTEYTGEFQDLGEYHPVCCWFWDMVENYFDHQTRIQLLEFVTGLSVVPIGGFAELLDENGQNRKFTLHGTLFEDCPFPRGDTMLNRIVLPLYESSNLMYETLVPSIQVGKKRDFE